MGGVTVRRALSLARRLRCILAAKSRDHCIYHGSSSAACSGGNTDTHLHHPQLLLISEADTRNHRRYNYLSWQVTHPPTAVAWSEGKWYEFHHSLTSGQPYHKGHH